MHSGSDSDSFDEGDLTARGRKTKGKAGARANEKGKQKAKDVRYPMPLLSAITIPFRLTLALAPPHSRAMPGRPRILAPGTRYRKTRLGASPVPSRNCLHADGDGGARLLATRPLSPCTHRVLVNVCMFWRTLLSDSSHRQRRYAVRSSAISSFCWTSRRR